jgi:hypothetical protein
MSEASKDVDHPEYLGYYLSAFVCASRSVRWHICHAAETNPQLEAWWDQDKTHLTPMFKFFDEIRNSEVHDETLIQTGDLILKRQVLTVDDWQTVIRYEATIPSFENYPGGPQGVFPACSKYHIQLEKLVKQAQSAA